MANLHRVKKTAFLNCILVIVLCCLGYWGFTSKDKTHLVHRGKRACSLIPFDVSCHERCPRPSEYAWKYLKNHNDCSSKFDGSRFHCAKSNDGKYVTACAGAVICSMGKEPILNFAEGQTAVAEISCQWCPEGHFNPDENKSSHTYPHCDLKRECSASEGQVECDVVKDLTRHWTDNKCRCDIKSNFIPLREKANDCTYDDIDCREHSPCDDTSDGTAQEYIYLASRYTCVPVCGHGFYPRTLDTDDCIAIENEGNRSFIQNISSNSIPKSVDSTVENSSPPVTVISTTSKGKGNKTLDYYLTYILLGVIAVILGGLILVNIYKRYRKRDPVPAQAGQDKPLVQALLSLEETSKKKKGLICVSKEMTRK